VVDTTSADGKSVVTPPVNVVIGFGISVGIKNEPVVFNI
jgi:hypothetical protein